MSHAARFDHNAAASTSSSTCSAARRRRRRFAALDDEAWRKENRSQLDALRYGSIARCCRPCWRKGSASGVIVHVTSIT